MLPVLFAAGMSLFDTSVVVALVIGGIVLIGLLAEKLGIQSGPLASIGSLDLEYVGFTIVGLFILTWLIALAIWRFGRIEERWSSPTANRSNSQDL